MSRLRVVPAREMIRLLRRLGFEEVRQRGSHRYLRHRDGRATVVPVHRGEDLGRGLIRSILRDIEVSQEEYSRLLRSR